MYEIKFIKPGGCSVFEFWIWAITDKSNKKVVLLDLQNQKKNETYFKQYGGRISSKSDVLVCKIQQYIKEVNEVFPGATLERRNGKIGKLEWTRSFKNALHESTKNRGGGML